MVQHFTVPMYKVPVHVAFNLTLVTVTGLDNIVVAESFPCAQDPDNTVLCQEPL